MTKSHVPIEFRTGVGEFYDKMPRVFIGGPSHLRVDLFPSNPNSEGYNNTGMVSGGVVIYLEENRDRFLGKVLELTEPDKRWRRFCRRWVTGMLWAFPVPGTTLTREELDRYGTRWMAANDAWGDDGESHTIEDLRDRIDRALIENRDENAAETI